MGFFPSMAPKYYRNHVNEKHPFMTCIVKVDTQSQWQKTVKNVLRRCHGVHSFRMDDNGIVEISGTVDPNSLLQILGEAGRSAKVNWLQFGECSSNLFMHTNHPHSQNGRYLQVADLSRPKLPSHRVIDSQTYGYGYGYGYDNPYNYSYGSKKDYYHDYHQHYGYRHDDSQQNYDREYGYGESQVRSRSAARSRSSEDMSCCTVM